MKKKVLVIAAVIILLICSYWFIDAHTYTFKNVSAADSSLKTEQIQAVFGRVIVWGTHDTDVVFTDAEDPDKTFRIGYITPGMRETVRLEAGHWYDVQGGGEITVCPVRLRER